MQRIAALMVLLVGCGGDDSSAKPDAYVNPGPDYDLSCLNNMITTVPTTLTLENTLFDATTATIAPIPNATITAYKVSDASEITNAMTDMDGKATMEIPTSGTPYRIYSSVDATGFVKSRHFVNIPPWKSQPGATVAVKQARIDGIATALGATLDSAMGTLEVWANDCSAKGELPGATVQLDGAATQWAMFGGQGTWIPRDTTLGAINNLRSGSVAGKVNVAPGMHTITVSAEGVSLTSTVLVEANTWTTLVMTPGHPLN